MVNDSKTVFARNEADAFPGIREWKMTGISGRPGNGNSKVDSLPTSTF